MTEEPGKLNPHRRKNHLPAVIGGALGAATALALGKLIGFESFWLGVVLVAGCTGLGGFLAQKLSSK